MSVKKKRHRLERFVFGLSRDISSAVPDSLYQFIKKWLPLGVLAGIAGAMAAILFAYMLSAFQKIYIWVINKNFLFILLLPTAGLLLSLYIIKFFKIPHNYHGMNAVIDAIHYKRGITEKKGWIAILLSSTASLGLGASGGPEGPVSYIAASISTNFFYIFKNILNIKKGDTKLFVISSIAGGLSAIFKAPFGGALFALEVPYLNDFESSATVPALVSGVTAYFIYTAIFGFAPVINVPVILLSSWSMYLPFIIITGIVCGIVSIIYVITINKISLFFKEVNKSNYLLPAVIGGLMISALSIFIPLSLGEGDAVLSDVFTTNFTWLLSFNMNYRIIYVLIPILLIFLIARLLTNAISLGAGAPLGVFYPALILGAITGLIIGVLFNIGSVGTDILIVVGMGSVLAGSTKTPISSVVLMAEMVGLYIISIPVAIAVILSYIISGNYTANSRQIIKKGFQIDLSVFENHAVKDICTKNVVTIPYYATIKEAQEIVSVHNHRFYPIISDGGGVVGVAYRDSLNKITGDLREKSVLSIMQSHFEYIDENASVIHTYNLMNEKQIGRAIVIESKSKFKLAGIITMRDIINMLDTPDNLE